MITAIVYSEGTLRDEDMLAVRREVSQDCRETGYNVFRIDEKISEISKLLHEEELENVAEIFEEIDDIINGYILPQHLWFGHHPDDPACIGIFEFDEDEEDGDEVAVAENNAESNAEKEVGIMPKTIREQVVDLLMVSKKPLMPMGMATDIGDGCTNVHVSNAIQLANTEAEETGQPLPFVHPPSGRGWLLAGAVEVATPPGAFGAHDRVEAAVPQPVAAPQPAGPTSMTLGQFIVDVLDGVTLSADDADKVEFAVKCYHHLT